MACLLYSYYLTTVIELTGVLFHKATLYSIMPRHNTQAAKIVIYN